jgi:hypothetical protein
MTQDYNNVSIDGEFSCIRKTVCWWGSQCRDPEEDQTNASSTRPLSQAEHKTINLGTKLERQTSKQLLCIQNTGTQQCLTPWVYK